MKRFIVFQLFGPLASWGEVAVGGVRSSETHPTRSGILGLVAGALGISREDLEAQRRLSDRLLIASDRLLLGHGLSDYHTAQVTSEANLRKAKKAGVSVRTRREALLQGELNTILSRRDYRADALWRVAMCARDDRTTDSLDDVLQALRRPHFIPFLGRKACPLALPLAPRLIDCAAGVEALKQYSLILPRLLEPHFAARLRSEQRHVAWEEGFPMGMDPRQTVRRRDHPEFTLPRLFASRHEHQVTLPAIQL